MPTHHGDIDLSLLHGGQRIVGADQTDRRPGGPLEAGDGVLRPRVGQQPTEPEADACLPPHGAERRVPARREHVRRGRGTSCPAWCRLHVPRTAVQKCHSERVFELLDGAAQRGLGDAEFVGGVGERLESRHRLEHPEVTQLDSAASSAPMPDKHRSITTGISHGISAGLTSGRSVVPGCSRLKTRRRTMPLLYIDLIEGRTPSEVQGAAGRSS